jgi:hypothetical protein
MIQIDVEMEHVQRPKSYDISINWTLAPEELIQLGAWLDHPMGMCPAVLADLRVAIVQKARS